MDQIALGTFNPVYDLGGIIVGLFAMRFIGHIWYSPYLFGKAWLEAAMREMREERSRAEVLLYGLGINLMTSVGLWLLINVAGNGEPTLAIGLVASFLAWATFSLPTGLMTVVFEERPLKLILINAGAQGLGFLVAGAFIGWSAGQ